MKQESIKSILRSYLKERQHSSGYDVADYSHEFSPEFHGFSFAPSKHQLVSQGFNGHSDEMRPESALPIDDKDRRLLVFQSASLPLDDHDVPLEPELDELAIGVGRRLSEISDEFDLNHINPINTQASSNETRCIQFKEHIICVPASCDHVQIPVVRRGDADTMVTVEWTTSDKSAKAGFHYVNSQGNISFAEGEEEKTIDVEIIRGLDTRTDIHFVVELFDAEGIFNTVTVNIVDDSRLCPEEKQSIKNIISLAPSLSMSEIVTCLHDRVTPNTFKAALRCLCSSVDTIPKELALASELVRLTLPYAPFSTLTNAFCEYFSYLPELEDIAHLF